MDSSQIVICSFSAKHAALRRSNGKYWLARNQDNVSSGTYAYQQIVDEVSYGYKHVGLVQSGHHHHNFMELNVTCSHHDIAEKLLIWHQTTIIHSLYGEL